MKNIFLFSFFFLCTITVFGQQTISGKITDATGTAIIGANIFIENTYDGTSSDIEGQFTFTTYEKESVNLIVTYIGFEEYTQSLLLQESPITLNIQLEEAASELKEIVITAGAFEASDEKKAVILNSIDIVTTAGATADIAGALNTLPGTQTVGETGQLFVRGGAASETRTYIDGLYVQNPYGSSVPNIPARGRFSPFLFKGMMFSTGGYSAEYGQALSSALILNSHDLAEETTTGLSVMSVGLGLSHTQRWENTSLSVTGNYYNLAPYTQLVPQNIRWETAPKGSNGQVIFRQKISETGIFKVHTDITHNFSSLQYPDINKVTETQQLDLINDNIYINTSYKDLLNDEWTLFAGMAYTDNTDEVKQGFTVNTNEKSLQGKLTLGRYFGNNLQLKFGGEYLHSNFQEDYTSLDANVFQRNLKENYTAAFVEASFKINENWVGRFGERVEYSELLNKWTVAPRLSLARKTGKNSQLSIAVGQFFQTPEKEVLRYNQQLDFEKADHYMLNYQVASKNRTFRIEGYFKNYHQLVKYDNETIEQSTNKGNGFAKGIDLFYRDKETIKNGDFWVSYSLLDTERDYRDFPTKATPIFASKHNLSFVYKHFLPKWTTSVGVTYSHGSPRPYNDLNTDGFNKGRTPSYNDLSLNASYLTSLFGNFTVVHCSVSNILGFENTFGYRYSQTPDETGQFINIAIQPPAKRFVFVGVFVSIGQKYGTVEDTKN